MGSWQEGGGRKRGTTSNFFFFFFKEDIIILKKAKQHRLRGQITIFLKDHHFVTSTVYYGKRLRIFCLFNDRDLHLGYCFRLDAFTFCIIMLSSPFPPLPPPPPPTPHSPLLVSSFSL